MMVFVILWGWWARDISRANNSEEEEVEGEKEESLGSHLSQDTKLIL
jgi:hypothetical protein